jgi:hypothetical protein
MNQCPAAGGRNITRLLSVLALLCLCSSVGGADQRQITSADSPPWLRSVGKLQVPGQRFQDGHTSHYLEDCSATLVTLPARDVADTIVTAWHCLELYEDLTRPITFILSATPGESLSREAYRLADGGGMHADWAILRLRQSVPVQPGTALRIHPQQADTDRPVIMAGYSKDSGLGNNGEQLTFDPACTISHQERSIGDTDCTAHKGASGGAVIQLSSTGDAYMCGVISQGNGEGRSTFVPVNGFRHAINLHLR